MGSSPRSTVTPTPLQLFFRRIEGGGYVWVGTLPISLAHFGGHEPRRGTEELCWSCWSMQGWRRPTFPFCFHISS